MKSILIVINFFFFLNLSYSNEEILLFDIDGGIGSFSAEHVKTVIKEAEAEKYHALILRLNTPGGLLEATRGIVSHILEAKVPVIVYVAPGGARAGSAGVFITLSGHIAAMAPGTNIGAAHPVGIDGSSGDSSDVMTSKVTNDAAAFVRSIADKRGRNIEWAEKTVRESISSTEEEALAENAIDFIAYDLDDLLKKINNFEVELNNGDIIILNTENSNIVVRELDLKETILSFLSDPNIAYIFMMLAIYGIMLELYNPGSMFPGSIGVVSAIIAGYSLQMLPVNIAGLALIIVSLVFFFLEIKIVSYGLLSIAGIICFMLGSFMLFDSPNDVIDISLSLIISTTVLTALLFGGIIFLAIKSQRTPQSTGNKSFLVENAIVFSKQNNGQYKVKVHGEIWNAVSDSEDFEINEKVKIIDVNGLMLKIGKINN